MGGSGSGVAKRPTLDPWGDPVRRASASSRAWDAWERPSASPASPAVSRVSRVGAAALPQTILPPLFNRYGPGQLFRDHVDNSIRRDPVTGANIRTDLSATLFLAEPETYDGGELIVEDRYGVHSVKLGAGDMVLYPASSLHRVTPITRGERVASFFWIQSLVRRDDQRTLLFDLDMAIQRLAATVGQDDASIVSMTGVYHNLLRMWAEV